MESGPPTLSPPAGAAPVTAPYAGAFFGRVGAASRLGLAWTLLLFLLGVLHFSYFFNRGINGQVEIGFQNYDWHKEYRYYSVYKRAVREGEWPFHIDRQIQRTQRFLAIPETVLSPQLILLRWLDIETFIYANTLLLYSIGFFGLYALQQRYRLSLFAFTVLWLFYSFNGHIIGHLCVGHSMWNGYFLLSWFFYFFLRWSEREPDALPRTNPLWIALIMFAIFLQGSFHVFVWCLLLLLLYVAFHRHYWRPAFFTALIAVLLSAVRILPAAITFWDYQKGFVPGYDSIRWLWYGLVTVQEPRRMELPSLGVEYGWWEYNLYIGYAGLAFLLWFGLVEARRTRTRAPHLRYASLDWPLLLMAILAVEGTFRFFAGNHIPLISGERAPSRFLIMPVLALFILGSLRLQAFLDANAHHRLTRWLGVTFLVFAWFQLAYHMQAWTIRTDREFIDKTSVHWMVGIEDFVDPAYEIWWWISLGITTLTLLAVLLLFRRYGRERSSQEATP